MLKFPNLIDFLIISIYFDIYIYDDYETKNFIIDKMNIYIPHFKEKCENELNFLISTFNSTNIIEFF